MRSAFCGTGLGLVSVLLVLVVIAVAACAPAAPPIAPTPPSPPAENQPPVIISLVDERPTILLFGSSRIKCTAYDPDGDPLTFTWSATGGNFSGAGPAVTWMAPGTAGSYKITVTISDGKGGSAQGSLTVTVVANQDPVISNLVADPAIVLPGKTSTITCIASDPDGDVLSFSWAASDGAIVGTGNQVIWKAPTRGGDHLVRVTVSDGKGGSAGANVIVKVISPEKTVTLSLVPEETGSVYWDGFVEENTLVGDDKDNRGIRAYFSFNIVPLAGVKVVSAKLTFTTKAKEGSPFISLGELYLERVDYGAFPLKELKRDVFDIDSSPLVKFYKSLPVEVDVTTPVGYLTKGVSPRFQIRARFDRVTDGNYGNDYIHFSDAILTITYIEE